MKEYNLTFDEALITEVGLKCLNLTKENFGENVEFWGIEINKEMIKFVVRVRFDDRAFEYRRSPYYSTEEESISSRDVWLIYFKLPDEYRKYLGSLNEGTFLTLECWNEFFNFITELLKEN